MALWGNLSKMASEATAKAVVQAKVLTEVTRLNALISDEEKQINDHYYQIGKCYFEHHPDNFEEEFAGLFTSITESQKKIQQYRLQIQNVKGVVRCDKCGAEVSKGAVYCSACGTQMPVSEIEAVDMPEKTCGKCGAVVEEGMRFCTACGNPLYVPEEPSSTQETEKTLQDVDSQPSVPGVSLQKKQQEENGEGLVCKNCGKKVEKGMRFCTACGKPVTVSAEEVFEEVPASEDTSKHRICENCGALMDDEDMFCTECGAKSGK